MGGLLTPVCLLLLGALAGGDAVRGPAGPLVGGGLGLVFGGGLLAALAGWLALTNPAVRQSPRNLLAVLNDGGLLLVPFAVFALMAELLLKWNGVQAFASAGLMASCASTGAAASRQGGSRWANTLGPSLIGMGASVAWMAATALLAGGGAR